MENPDKMNRPSSSKASDLHLDRFQAVRLPLPESGFDEYADIFAANEAPRDMAILRWRYTDNPCRDASRVYLALDVQGGAEQAAAIYAIAGVPFRIAQQQCAGSQSLDTLTDKSYRRMGLFNWLGETTYTDAARSGVQLVYGFPNAFSGPGFVKQLSWNMLGPAPFLIRPLRTGYFARQVLNKVGAPASLSRALDFALPIGRVSQPRQRALELREMQEFSDDYDALWAAFSAEVSVCVERSARYMNWRIFDRPGDGYVVLGAYDDNELRGVSIWLVRVRHGACLGYLIELLVRPGDSTVQGLLLKETLRRMKCDGAEAVLAWQLPHSPSYRGLRKAGFFTLPPALRPLKLDWGVRAFDSAVADTLSDYRNWYLSYVDSDTV
jgi:hypothetical protein